MTRSEKIAYNKAEKRIERTYYQRCSGIQIDIMDISKVFAYGRELIALGTNDPEFGDALLAYVQTLAEKVKA